MAMRLPEENDSDETIRMSWGKLVLGLGLAWLVGVLMVSGLRRLDPPVPAPPSAASAEIAELVQMMKYRDDYLSERTQEVKDSNLRVEKRLNNHLDRLQQCKAQQTLYDED